MEKIDKSKYVVLDVETNGLSSISCDLLSISIYSPDNQKVYNRFLPLELNDCVLTTGINGITEEMLLNKPALNQEEFNTLINDFDLENRIILHYGAIDEKFIKNYLKRKKIKGFENLKFYNIKHNIISSKFSEGNITKDNLCELYNIENVTKIHSGINDCILEWKLFEKMKVDRVSVNPQTMNADTLAKINRRHTPEDVVDTLKRVKEYGFTVNMDLIAGLPGENAEIFRDSLDKCAALAPENVTVHTLALKRGSTMKEENISSASENEVSEMVDYARKALSDAGYKPYYLYRQKYMTGNLENVGYAKSGFQ